MIKWLSKKLPNALLSFNPEPSIHRREQSLLIGKRYPEKPYIRQQLAFQELNSRLTITVYQELLTKRKGILRFLKKMSRTLVLTLISMQLIQSHALGATRTQHFKFWDRHELVVFYKSSCSHCKQFGSVLHSMVQTMQIPMVSMTLDNARDPNYQNTAPMLPLLSDAFTQLSRKTHGSNVSTLVLQLFLQNIRAKNLPLVFLMSGQGNLALISSGAMRSDRWLQQLLHAMQAMAQAERGDA